MQQEEKALKASWTLKIFLTVSSLIIFAMGWNSAANWKGVELFNVMCLLIPFFTLYAWYNYVKRMIIYPLIDLHFGWWVALAILSAVIKNESYFYISLVMILINFYRILLCKGNFILKQWLTIYSKF